MPGVHSMPGWRVMSDGHARIVIGGGGMKFRVEHDALAEAVAWVARALASRPVVPVLSGLRLDAAEGLTLSCFDYELSAVTHLPPDVVEPGSAPVPRRLLPQIIRTLPPPPPPLPP